MVSAVIGGKQLCGMSWIPQDPIEIYHAVEFAAAANPVVDLLTHSFSLGSVKRGYQSLEIGVLKRRIGRANDTNALLMRSRDELTVAGDEV